MVLCISIAIILYSIHLFGDNAVSDDLLKAANTGNASAQLEIGEIYYSGRGVEKDYKLALDWLRKAADQQNAQADCLIGQIYENGFGVPKDDSTAFHWYLLSAQGGNSDGQLRVGDFYANGEGVVKSESESVEWYKKSAVQGNNIALTRVGFAYLNGLGVERNPEQAFKYFLHAAYNDFGPAQYDVALFYFQGLYVTRDIGQAYKWSKLAIQRPTDSQAINLLEKVRSMLSEAELKDADEMVERWESERKGNFQPSSLKGDFKTGQVAKMRFEWIGNKIILQVRIGSSGDLKFILDTGASTSSIDRQTAITLGIWKDENHLPITGIGENLVLGNRIDNTTLELQGLAFRQCTLVSIPNLSFGEMLGMHVDGLIGYDLLRLFVVSIDYDNHTVSFMDPSVFHKNDISVSVPMSNLNSRVSVMVKLTDIHSRESDAELKVDTGSDSTFYINEKFLRTNPLFEIKKGISEKEEGVGGVVESEITRCTKIQVGDIVFENPIIVLASQNYEFSSGNEDGLLGNEILRRFEVTFDFPDNELYLRANSHIKEPYEYARSGLAIEAQGVDLKNYVVTEVAPDSPGAIAGFKKGDTMVEMDGLNMNKVSMDELRAIFHTEGIHHLIVNRGEQKISLDLKIDDPLKVEP